MMSQDGDGGMDDKQRQLREIIANYWQLDGDAIDWDVEFSSERLRNFSSLRMLRFLASVEERLEVSIANPDAIKRLRDLLRLVS